MRTLIIIYCGFCYGVGFTQLLNWFDIAPLKYSLCYQCNFCLDLIIEIFKTLFAPLYLPLRILYNLLKPIMER